jgi:SAM-dependent methyltransferase
MARTEPFDRDPSDYDAWFYRHAFVYRSEVEAIRPFIPRGKKGVEIGIGTGRFSLPFGIREGVEPSAAMREIARMQGLKVYDGVAENLPLKDQSFDFALMVTTVCFVDDVLQSFGEVNRILKPTGTFIIGLVDKESLLGRAYAKTRDASRFYRIATFYSVEDVMTNLAAGGFRKKDIFQTVFGDLASIHEVQISMPGYGEGGFVVMNAAKREE